MIAALWAFRGPIAIVLSILSILAVLWGYGHSRYNAGLEVGHQEAVAAKLELKLAKEQWQGEVKIWQQQVKEQTEALAKAKAEKEEIVKQNLQNFFKQKTIIDKNRSNREAEIKASIKPTDTITVPGVFERVYNDAVKGSNLIFGDKGDLQVPKDRPSIVGETKTFDALAFTQVVVGNAEEYNRLALRCSKLIDTVVQLEAKYGANAEGSERQIVATGGDILDGAIRDQLF